MEPASFARVKSPVRGFQGSDREMKITLSGGKGSVSKKLLDVAETGSIAHEVRGAGMPPDVNRAPTRRSSKRRSVDSWAPMLRRPCGEFNGSSSPGTKSKENRQS